MSALGRGGRLGVEVREGVCAFAPGATEGWGMAMSGRVGGAGGSVGAGGVRWLVDRVGCVGIRVGFAL